MAEKTSAFPALFLLAALFVVGCSGPKALSVRQGARFEGEPPPKVVRRAWLVLSEQDAERIIETAAPAYRIGAGRSVRNTHLGALRQLFSEARLTPPPAPAEANDLVIAVAIRDYEVVMEADGFRVRLALDYAVADGDGSELFRLATETVGCDRAIRDSPWRKHGWPEALRDSWDAALDESVRLFLAELHANLALGEAPALRPGHGRVCAAPEEPNGEGAPLLPAPTRVVLTRETPPDEAPAPPPTVEEVAETLWGETKENSMVTLDLFTLRGGFWGLSCTELYGPVGSVWGVGGYWGKSGGYERSVDLFETGLLLPLVKEREVKVWAGLGLLYLNGDVYDGGERLDSDDTLGGSLYLGAAYLRERWGVGVRAGWYDAGELHYEFADDSADGRGKIDDAYRGLLLGAHLSWRIW